MLAIRRAIAEAYGFRLETQHVCAVSKDDIRIFDDGKHGRAPSARRDLFAESDVREFILWVPEEDKPFWYSVVLSNAGVSTATFLLNFNGALYQNTEAICRAIENMPPEYPDEPVYRKAWRLIRDSRYHYTPLTGLRWQHTPALFLNSIGFGYCDDSASLLYYLWKALGYEAREWHLSGHVVSEVFVNGRWEMYDAGIPGVAEDYFNNYRGLQQCVYYYNRDGLVAGVEELMADGTLITEPHTPINPLLPDSHPFYCYSSNIASIYTTTNNNWIERWYMVDEPDYALQFQIPPGGTLTFPGYFTNALRVMYGDPAPPMMATVVLSVPAGYTGTLDNRLVIHSIRGSPENVVYLAGTNFAVGSVELQNFIDGRVYDRGSFFSTLTFTQVTTTIEVVFLLNPKLMEMQYSNVVVVVGSEIDEITAATRCVFPELKPDWDMASSSAGVQWTSSARFDYTLQLCTGLTSAVWQDVEGCIGAHGTGGRMSCLVEIPSGCAGYFRLKATQRW